MSKQKDLFSMTISKLMEVAEEDDIITEEEMEIIKQVEVDIDSYSLILQGALEDGRIDEDENKQLEQLKATIMERAETIAELDGILDDEEKSLLSTLSQILADYYITK